MGRDRHNEAGNEHFAKMVRKTMETAAWRSLTPYAQALYPWLKLEWRGPRANNNGQVRLSVRQAATSLGVNRKTVAKAFHELQAKGFIVATQPAQLGLGGSAVGPSWEITEIGMPGQAPGGRRLFQQWEPGRDYPVYLAAVQNPRGINGQSAVRPFKVVK